MHLLLVGGRFEEAAPAMAETMEKGLHEAGFRGTVTHRKTRDAHYWNYYDEYGRQISHGSVHASHDRGSVGDARGEGWAHVKADVDSYGVSYPTKDKPVGKLRAVPAPPSGGIYPSWATPAPYAIAGATRYMGMEN